MDEKVCRDATLALGAVAPTPVVATEASDVLAGQELTEEILAEAGERAASAAMPIDDIRATKEYRLELLKVLTRRVLRVAAERAQGN
jgi:carbon-monoxide dehydrogenase medium subunit